MSEQQPQQPDPDQKEEPSAPRGQVFARLLLPLLLLGLVWMSFSSLPGMAQSVIASTTYEERCPTEFEQVTAVLNDTGIEGLSVTTLKPLGHPDGDGSAYVVAALNCSPEYVVIEVASDATSTRASLVDAGWAIDDGGAGEYTASKDFDGETWVLSYPSESTGQTAAMVLRAPTGSA